LRKQSSNRKSADAATHNNHFSVHGSEEEANQRKYDGAGRNRRLWGR
jgi:hypothetical protein